MTAEPPQGTAAIPGQADGGDEVEQLRQQVAELQTRLDASADTAPVPGLPLESGGRDGRWRPWVAGLLIVLAALLAPAAVVATWAHDQVSNTDRYVETVTPLASDPAVQNAVIDRITREIFQRIDVKAVSQQAIDALVARGLPPTVAAGLTALTTPLADGVHDFVEKKVREIVTSPNFQTAWVDANRQAHTQLVAVLSGQGSKAVDVSGGTVSVNLATVINSVKADLEKSGFGLAARIPAVNAQFTVLESADLKKGQTAYRVLNTSARVLPLLALVLLGVAVFLARDRRKALMWSGLAVAASMLLLGLTLNAARAFYLDAVPADQLSPAAAATIFDTVVDFIRLNLRAVLVVALAVAAGGWLSGRSAAAVATRRGLHRGSAAVRGGVGRTGLSTGPVGDFFYTYRTVFRAVIIGGAVLAYIQQAHPTGASTAKVLAVAVVLLLVVELFARPPAVTSASAPDA